MHIDVQKPLTNDDYEYIYHNTELRIDEIEKIYNDYHIICLRYPKKNKILFGCGNNSYIEYIQHSGELDYIQNNPNIEIINYYSHSFNDTGKKYIIYYDDKDLKKKILRFSYPNAIITKHMHDEYDTISLDLSNTPTFLLDIGNPLCDLSNFLIDKKYNKYDEIALEGLRLPSSSKSWISSICVENNVNVEILNTCTHLHRCKLYDSSDVILSRYFN